MSVSLGVIAFEDKTDMSILIDRSVGTVLWFTLVIDSKKIFIVTKAGKEGLDAAEVRPFRTDALRAVENNCKRIGKENSDGK